MRYRLATGVVILGFALAAHAQTVQVVTPGVLVPGPKTHTGLVKVSANNTMPAYYVDELSAQPSNHTGLIDVWVLEVFAKDTPQPGNTRAMWRRYLVNCKDRTYQYNIRAHLDATGKILEVQGHDAESAKFEKDTVAEAAGSFACGVKNLVGTRHQTIAAAIEDATLPPLKGAH